jgi:hypothetical protein
MYASQTNKQVHRIDKQQASKINNKYLEQINNVQTDNKYTSMTCNMKRSNDKIKGCRTRDYQTPAQTVTTYH